MGPSQERKAGLRGGCCALLCFALLDRHQLEGDCWLGYGWITTGGFSWDSLLVVSPHLGTGWRPTVQSGSSKGGIFPADPAQLSTEGNCCSFGYSFGRNAGAAFSHQSGSMRWILSILTRPHL